MLPRNELFGGGRILAGWGASIPLVALRYDDSGVGIRTRWGWLSHDSCTFEWSEVIVIERAKRSLVVRALRGRSFRFVTFHSVDLDPVVHAARIHQVSIEEVRGTYRWNFSPN